MSNLEGRHAKAEYSDSNSREKEGAMMIRFIGEAIVAVVGIWIILTLVVAFAHAWL